MLSLPLLVFGLASVAVGQQIDVFTPQGSDLYISTKYGLVPKITHITAHLAQLNATLPFCPGNNDVLAVTFVAPIVDPITPDKFNLHLCKIPQDDNYDKFPIPGTCEYSATPKCAVLSSADEPNERRTVLLAGSFSQRVDQNFTYGPVMLSLNAISMSVDGQMISDFDGLELPSRYGWGLLWGPGGHDPPLVGYGEGPFLADISLLDFAAPINTASADPNGCAALHPSATYAVRLLFASAVHERAADGSLAPFGTNATAAAALFSIRNGDQGNTMSPDRVVGLADVDGDNVVDVCIEGAAGEPQVEAVVINCTAGDLLTPDGIACKTTIKAFVRAEDVPGEEAGSAARTDAPEIALCFEQDPANCPGITSGAAKQTGLHTVTISLAVGLLCVAALLKS